MKKVYSAGGIIVRIIEDQIKILLVKHKEGYLVFPKGHIDEGETPEEAAPREVQKKTGILGLSIVKKLGMVTRPSREEAGDEVIMNIHLYLMDSAIDEVGDACEDCDWFSLDEAKARLGFKQERDFLTKAEKELINWVDK